MQNIAIILTIIFAIIVYVVILAITKIFSKDELYMLPFYSKFKKNKAWKPWKISIFKNGKPQTLEI